jgi:hypothetical protein
MYELYGFTSKTVIFKYKYGTATGITPVKKYHVIPRPSEREEVCIAYTFLVVKP